MKSKDKFSAITLKKLSSQKMRLDPFSWFQSCRRENSINFDLERKCWDVFRYEDIYQILKDQQNFSMMTPSVQKFNQEWAGRSSISNPPDLTKFKQFAKKIFSTQSLENWITEIKMMTEQLLKPHLLTGKMDIVEDLAYHLPLMVIARFIGLPVEDCQLFSKWTFVLLKGVRENTHEERKKLIEEKTSMYIEFYSYFRKVIERRKEDPQKDLLSLLLSCEVDGKQLSEIEILNICLTLLASGHETTMNLISSAVRCLLEQPMLQFRLRTEPVLFDSFIEEVLRYYPPVIGTMRFALKDIELKGYKIATGDAIVLWNGSGNRDEFVFDDVDQFIVDRSPNPHLSFGYGKHYCLGSALARLEAKIVVQVLLNEIEYMELINTFRPEASVQSNVLVYGWNKLPITFKTFAEKY
jgi:cytochrome P450